MNGTILFPYNINITSPFAYYYAIELARKINHNLKIVSAYQPSNNSKSFFRRNVTDKSLDYKKQLHLKLLELNGYYLERYNQWQGLNEIKIKCLLKPGRIENVLFNLIKQKSSRLLLIDYYTFTEKLLLTDFLSNIRNSEFKLWIMPPSIEGFKAKPDLNTGFFNTNKKEIFGELFCLTKLYNIPNDLHLIKPEFRSKELIC